MRSYVCTMNTCSSWVVCYVEFDAEDGEKSRFSPQNHVDWSVHGETKGGGQLSSEFAPLIREIGQNRGLERVEQLELRVLAFVCLLIENKLVPLSPVSVSAPRRVRAIKVQKCPGWVLCGEGGGWWEEGKRSIPLHIAWCVLSVWGRLKKKYGRRHPTGLVGEGEY